MFCSCLQIGVPSNLYALYHAAVQLRQRNELGVYLINLTVSDLLYLTSLPLWLQYIFQVLLPPFCLRGNSRFLEMLDLALIWKLHHFISTHRFYSITHRNQWNLTWD